MVTCEEETVQAVTENGRVLTVRLIHECKLCEPEPGKRFIGIA